MGADRTDFTAQANSAPPSPTEDVAPAWPALLEALPVAAYACDPAGLITYFNPAAVELWGRAPRLRDGADRYCGSLRLFTPAGEAVPHDRCWMAKAVLDGVESSGGEIVVERPDGTRRTATAHTTVARDAAGAVRGAVNVLLDVTARREAAALGATVERLQATLSARATGVTPICCHCKQVRDAAGAWHPVERYLRERTGEEVSHGICPGCFAAHYADAR